MLQLDVWYLLLSSWEGRALIDSFIIFSVFCLVFQLMYIRGSMGYANEMASAVFFKRAQFFFKVCCFSYVFDYLLSFFFYYRFASLDFLVSSDFLGLVKLSIAFLSFLLLVLAEGFFLKEGARSTVVPEFIVIAIIAVVASFAIVESKDFVLMALFLELLSYCLLVLPVLYRFSNLSLESTIRYFILGCFSSAFLLYGISCVFASFGTTVYADIICLLSTGVVVPFASAFGVSSYFLNDSFVGFSFLLIFCAFFFKLGLFPFHFWIRDVYEGAPLPVTAFFATVAKVPILFVLWQLTFLLFSSFGGNLFFFEYLFEVVGISSIFYGTIASFYETRLKGFFAFTGVANMGYILLALSLHSYFGIIVVIQYLIMYSFTTFSVFFFLVVFSSSRLDYLRLTDFVVLLRANSFLGFFLVAIIFTAAGLPPLPGFFPKIFLIYAFFIRGDWLLALLLGFFNVLNFILYARILRFLAFYSGAHSVSTLLGFAWERSFSFVAVVSIVLSVFFVILLPLYFWGIIFFLVWG